MQQRHDSSHWHGQAVWLALRVKSRHEFITNAELQKKGISTFLPTVTKLRQWKDRKKLVEFPLFTGYVFVHAPSDPESRVRVLKTRGAVNLISAAGGEPAVVSDDEISALKLVIESGQQLDIYPHLHEGDRIRVSKGVLKGAEGVLLSKESNHIFVVNVEILSRSVGVKILADEIEKV
ncbi:MAG: UpxY family transcription antiterminator [Nitrospiraceae bacterium]|nr:UpxY family transcription antiterminator [Nitrospiraceae bacterium]